MRLLLWAVLLVLQSCLVHAVHRSDVGLIDWYKKLVGVPLTTTAQSPSFHHVRGRDIILTATMSNVLAALDAKDGQVGEYADPTVSLQPIPLSSVAVHLRGRGYDCWLLCSRRW
jgi:hypothetical protein